MSNMNDRIAAEIQKSASKRQDVMPSGSNANATEGRQITDARRTYHEVVAARCNNEHPSGDARTERVVQMDGSERELTFKQTDDLPVGFTPNVAFYAAFETLVENGRNRGNTRSQRYKFDPEGNGNQGKVLQRREVRNEETDKNDVIFEEVGTYEFKPADKQGQAEHQFTDNIAGRMFQFNQKIQGPAVQLGDQTFVSDQFAGVLTFTLTNFKPNASSKPIAGLNFDYVIYDSDVETVKNNRDQYHRAIKRFIEASPEQRALRRDETCQGPNGETLRSLRYPRLRGEFSLMRLEKLPEAAKTRSEGGTLHRVFSGSVVEDHNGAIVREVENSDPTPVIG